MLKEEKKQGEEKKEKNFKVTCGSLPLHDAIAFIFASLQIFNLSWEVFLKILIW